MNGLLIAYLLVIILGTLFGKIVINDKVETNIINRFIVMVLLGWIPVAIIGLPILGIIYLL